MKIRFPIILIAAALIAGSCGKSLIKESEIARLPGYVPAEKQEADDTVESLLSLNESSPRTFSSRFQLSFKEPDRGYAFSGRLAYNTGTDTLNLKMEDLVFRSPVVTFIQSGPRVAMYFYREKRLYRTGVSRMNLKRVSDLDIDYELVHELATGNIPLIKKFREIVVLKSGASRAVVILKDRKYYERIYLYKMVPRKIEFIRKATGEKYVVTLAGYTRTGNSRYYRNISLTAPHLRTGMELRFSGARVNRSVRLRSADEFTPPPGARVISF